MLILLLTRRAGGYMRATLVPETAAVTVTDAELDATAGNHRDRIAFLRSGAEGTGRRHRSLVLRAVGDLVEDVRSGSASDIEHSRAGLARIRDGRP